MSIPPVSPAGPDLVLARARVLDLLTGDVGDPQDLHVIRGRLSRQESDQASPVWDLDGGIVMPGLWDAHVHFGQWAQRSSWTDLSTADSAEHAARLLARALAGHDPDQVLVAHGFRDSRWPAPPSEQVLEHATGGRPVVALSADLHAVWTTRSARHLLGLSHLGSSHLVEQSAFEITARVTAVDPGRLDAQVRRAAQEAARLGVVGITDFEMADTIPDWQRRMAQGFDTLVVRTGIYPRWLDLASQRGLATGDLLDDQGLLLAGPLKVITDGSLTARTAWCREPYADSSLGAVDPDHPHGRSTVGREDLVHLMATASAQGLECAVHAIGDAAVASALDAFEETGARGTLEHAQLVTAADVVRMARLGVRASVQPAHLLDDRDAMDALWPRRRQDAFPFASMARAGIQLSFGSDAPVAALDPWLAIEAAVRRTIGDREPWGTGQQLTLSQALVASCRGVTSLVAGAEADLIVLDENPFDLPNEQLHAVRPRATLVGGRVTAGC